MIILIVKENKEDVEVVVAVEVVAEVMVYHLILVALLLLERDVLTRLSW